MIQHIKWLLLISLISCANTQLAFEDLTQAEALSLYKNEPQQIVYLLINCHDNHLSRDSVCLKVQDEMITALTLLPESDQQKILASYKFRWLDCWSDTFDYVCKKFDFMNEKKGKIRFILPSLDEMIAAATVYHYTSPLEARYFKLKLPKMIEKEDVEQFNGTLQQLQSHPLIIEEKRNIIALVSSKPDMILKFKEIAKTQKERAFAFLVAPDPFDPLNEKSEPAYVIGPNGFIEKYNLPVDHKMGHVTDMELRNLFQNHALPKAIILRNYMIDHHQFLDLYGNFLIYVILIDTRAPDIQNEFIFQYRDWIASYSEQEQRTKNFTFAILDLSYHDRQNKHLFAKYGFMPQDQPTIFALSKPSTGNFYRQPESYNGSNFQEISEGFKTKVERGEMKEWSSKWGTYYLSLMNPGYWKTFGMYRFLQNFIFQGEEDDLI